MAIGLITMLLIEFFVFSSINKYKDSIAEYASLVVSQKVVIGNIEPGWQGLNPYLSLSNIDIYDAENRPALHLKNTDLSFSWLSIPLLEPRLNSLTIHSPELTMRRNKNGDFFIGGMLIKTQSKPDFANWLLRQSQLKAIRAKVIWIDETREAPPLSLENLNLHIERSAWNSFLKNYHVHLSATPSYGTKTPILVSANLHGNDVSQLGEWLGSARFQLKNADLVAFKPWIDYSLLTQSGNLQSGIGSADINIEFANNKIHSIASNFALKNVQLALKENAAPLIFNTLTATVKLEKNDKNQSVEVSHLTLEEHNGLSLKDATGAYSRSAQGDEKFKLALAHIDLAFLKNHLAQWPLPEDLLFKINTLSPTGTLDDMSLEWQGKQSIATQYVLNAKFNHLSILADKKIPGLSNFSGEIKANQSDGNISLNTQNAQLELKETLRWPIPIDNLHGDISWSNNGNKTHIKTSKLSMSNPHLAGAISAEYFMGGNDDGYLDLSGQFNKGNAKYALFYYPIALGKTTLHWLDTSILEGAVEDIHLNIKGRLADFPFVDSNNNPNPQLGTFKVSAEMSKVLLEYGTGWPVIEDLGLNLLFEGKRMELNANKGHIFGNQIIKSKATIATLDADWPILNIESDLAGPVAEGVKFVNKSPVADVTLGFTKDLKTSGQGKLNLALKIPMQDLDSAQYKGLYQITNGSMDNDSIPALTKINGTLAFTESSLNAKNISANTLASPMTLNLNAGKDKIVRVEAKGKLSNETIKQALLNQDEANRNWAKISNYISGSANWVSEIVIQKPMVTMNFRSDLVGISTRLPAPLNKAANERWEMRLDKKENISNATLSVTLANKLAAKIIHTSNNGKFTFDRGSIYLNDKPSTNRDISNLEATSAKGLQLYGNFNYLDADAWRGVVRSLSDASKQDVPFAVQKLALKINMLDIYDRRINQLKISNSPDKDGVHLNVQSEQISGDVQWTSQNNGKLIARLSKLIVPDAAPNKTPAAKKTVGEEPLKLDQDYPALDITADSFEVNKKSFGALELVAYQKKESWIIQKLNLTSPDSEIHAEGKWSDATKNPNTQLNVRLDFKNLGKALKNIGYADTIKGGSGNLIGQLNWAGGPHEFNLAKMNGDFQLALKKGQFLKVQPGVGRLLGLLSLQSLPRRLSLDFRDLFSNGFAFDKIDANFKIDQGLMRSDNFTMSGPAADVIIKGKTDLQKETQNLSVKVMPHISDSVSLTALSGGPLVAAVAFLAQKILKDPLNKIASSHYEIAGTWDNPQEVESPNSEAKPALSN